MISQDIAKGLQGALAAALRNEHRKSRQKQAGRVLAILVAALLLAFISQGSLLLREPQISAKFELKAGGPQ